MLDYHVCGYVGYGDLQVSDINDNNGILEFRKHDGTWGYVCSSGFNEAAGRVACQQLGYTYRNYFNR